jgi:hypothetical protein
MSVTTRIAASSLPSEAIQAFEIDVVIASEAYNRLREEQGLPDSDVIALLADDFVGEVDAHLQGPFRAQEGDTFTTDRVGGVVVAKTLDQSADASRQVIVFDASWWRNAAQPEHRLRLAHIVAHELAHTVIERARHASGAMNGVLIPSVTGNETARSMARIMAGEYRADLLAEIVVGGYITATVDGETRPGRTWYVDGNDHVSRLAEVLARAHPAWPNIVQDYRERRSRLEEMWVRIAALTDQTLTNLIHCQAAADAADASVDILGSPPLVELPAVTLYLLEPWANLLAALRATPLLSNLSDVVQTEAAVVEAGSAAIVDIWRRLGLRVEEQANRRWSLWVGAPLR